MVNYLLFCLNPIIVCLFFFSIQMGKLFVVLKKSFGWKFNVDRLNITLATNI